MKFRNSRDWGISTRLVAIAIVPAIAMFIAVSLALYVSTEDEVQDSVQDRGSLLAASLAESAQYGVISGNTPYLETTMRGLLAVDSSIKSIAVFDANNKQIATVGDIDAVSRTSLVFERSIRGQTLDVDLFGPGAGPHVSGQTDRSSLLPPAESAGRVEVVMSPEPIFEARRGRLYLGIFVVMVAAVLSGFAGLYFAQRLRQPLYSVLDAIRQVRQGNYDITLPPSSNRDFADLQNAILEMAGALHVSRDELERQVVQRTQELETAMSQAMDADAQRRRLLAQSNALLEQERQQIALEIHDHLNASLIGVQFEADKITDIAEKLSSHDGEELQRIANQIRKTISELYAAARAIVKQLRPEVVDTLGLKGAVEGMVRDYDGLHSDCHYTSRAEADFPRLRGDLAMTAYRVIQEALTNIAKHASATRARVTLAPGSNNDTVRITVSDNGRGFDERTAAAARGLGLIGMRERVAAAGGTLNVTSSPGAGTKITIDLPLAHGS